MRATITASVALAGETANISQTRTDDGIAGTTPVCPAAIAGTLATYTSTTDGVIDVASTIINTGDKGVVTWTDALGFLKHRYNVDCTVAAGGTGKLVTITGGAGDDLPAEDYALFLALQVECTVTFDFDDMDTFLVSMATSGVVAFIDGTATEKLVTHMDAKGLGLWLKDSGFPAPMSGTPITKCLCGSGSITAFEPKILALYDAVVGSGS